MRLYCTLIKNKETLESHLPHLDGHNIPVFLKKVYWLSNIEGKNDLWKLSVLTPSALVKGSYSARGRIRSQMGGPVSSMNALIIHPQRHWCVRFHAGEHSSQRLRLSDTCHMCSVWTCSHLWAGQGVDAGLPILMSSGVGQWGCLVHGLSFACVWPPQAKAIFLCLFPLSTCCLSVVHNSRWVRHICSRLVSFLKSLYCQQLRVWRQFYDVFNSRRFKQVSKWVLYPIITSYLSQQLRGEMTKLCECLGKHGKWPKTLN